MSPRTARGEICRQSARRRVGLAATALVLVACSGSIDNAGRQPGHASGSGGEAGSSSTGDGGGTSTTVGTTGSSRGGSSAVGSSTATSSTAVGTTSGAGGTSSGNGGASGGSSGVGNGGMSTTGGAAGAAGGNGGTSGGSAGSGGAVDAGRDAEVGTVLWDGDASKGTGVFKILNNEGTATITAVTDATYGPVWRFLKTAASNRCEAHGAKALTAKEGDIWYIGWRSKLSWPQSLTTNALFQWKAYGANLLQNYPIVIKTLNGRLALEQYNPGSGGNSRTLLWTTPFAPDTWHTYVLAIKVSADINTGYLEFWFDGVQQMLSNGSMRFTCRTLDGDYCDPKWGVYGATGTEAINLVDSLRIGTTVSAVLPPP